MIEHEPYMAMGSLEPAAIQFILEHLHESVMVLLSKL